MFRSVRTLATAAALVTLALVLSTAPALAGLPTPPNVTISSNHINLVGRNSAAVGDQADDAALLSKVTVTVRDLGNLPLPNVPILLDFFDCASDVRIAGVQSYHGEIPTCGPATVQGLTGLDGTFTFAVIGGRSGSVPHVPHCCRVFADTNLAGTLSVGTFDENNISGVNGADLSLFGVDLYLALNPERSDFNGDGLVNGLDLSILGGTLFAGRSSASGVSICP